MLTFYGAQSRNDHMHFEPLTLDYEAKENKAKEKTYRIIDEIEPLNGEYVGVLM